MRKIQKIRPLYAPANIACDIHAKNGIGYCPVTQDYDAEQKKYKIDRANNATVLVPSVAISAEDGSLHLINANSKLVQIKWFVLEGKIEREISSIEEWKGGYVIDTSDTSDKGTITISKNLTSTQMCSLRFSAIYPDTRVGVNIPISSKSITLSTNIALLDKYKASLSCESSIIYNPIIDRLLDFDYLLKNKLVEESSRSEYLDDKSYSRRVDTNLYRGGDKINDYSIKIYEISQNGNVLLSSDEKIKIFDKYFILDIRFILKMNLKIEFIVNNIAISKEILNISRANVSINAEMIGANTYSVSTDKIMYKALFYHNGKGILYPQAHLHTEWIINRKYNGTGEKNSIPIEKLEEIDVELRAHPLNPLSILEYQGQKITINNQSIII